MEKREKFMKNWSEILILRLRFQSIMVALWVTFSLIDVPKPKGFVTKMLLLATVRFTWDWRVGRLHGQNWVNATKERGGKPKVHTWRGRNPSWRLTIYNLFLMLQKDEASGSLWFWRIQAQILEFLPKHKMFSMNGYCWRIFHFFYLLSSTYVECPYFLGYSWLAKWSWVLAMMHSIVMIIIIFLRTPRESDGVADG